MIETASAPRPGADGSLSLLARWPLAVVLMVLLSACSFVGGDADDDTAVNTGSVLESTPLPAESEASSPTDSTADGSGSAGAGGDITISVVPTTVPSVAPADSATSTTPASTPTSQTSAITALSTTTSATSSSTTTTSTTTSTTTTSTTSTTTTSTTVPTTTSTTTTSPPPTTTSTTTTSTTTTTTTTTTAVNRAPQVVLADEIRVEVGQSVSFAADVRDPEGDIVELEYRGLPAEAEVRPGNIIRFEPNTAGQWDVTVRAIDPSGNFGIGRTTLVARLPQRGTVVLAMGDSVPAGNGLDVNDYFRNDLCYRGEGLSYPYRVFNELNNDGRLGDPAAAQIVLSACSGHTTRHMLVREVTAPGAGSNLVRTQMDWAAHLNPDLIMLTIGANDTEFDTPTVLADDDGRLVEGEVAARIATIDQNLPVILDRLLNETDAVIVVTNYHNPASENANGLGSCTGSCFWDQAEQVVARINAAVVRAVDDANSDRIAFADVYPLFEGRGAPNGLFPDYLREDGSVFGDFLSQYTDPIQPYCAANLGNFGTWVNSIDCIHPTREGHDAYAGQVLNVMDDAGFLP